MAITDLIQQAGSDGKLLKSTVENLNHWLSGTFLPSWAQQSIEELVHQQQWNELNDRFYQTMAFGTGGLRGRTIGRITPAAEMGTPGKLGEPEHPGVGTNMLNDFTIVRATVGLFRYTKKYLLENEEFTTPKLVICHDVRHYSRYFCELAASVWTQCGGLALIFDGPRSTPFLSFSIRHLKANAGVNITASHNPPHDNGYKAYFGDGGQLVSPHAENVIREVNAVRLDEVPQFLKIDLGNVITLPASVGDAYLEALEENILDAELLEKFPVKLVFTPNHGTGQVAALPMMKANGVDIHTVEEQMTMDGRFPATGSANPENASAFDKAIALADKIGADGVIATDPDADRLGCGARDKSGKMRLYTGNQLGSAIAEYRIMKLKEIGVLPEEGSENAALIKTFVTTPLQEAIAEKHGLKCINTLTGFKWIGEKLKDYEDQLKENLWEEEGLALDYDQTEFSTRIQLLLEYSTYYVFGGEESYGYLASDRVRDKDANAACILFCELMSYLQSRKMTLDAYLDSLYVKYGYYLESLINMVFEGASGSQAIQNILASYASNPPAQLNGVAITKVINFNKDELQDADQKPIPREKFFFVELANGYRYAVRGSGTEPKIKFYCFAREDVKKPSDLAAAKQKAEASVKEMKTAIEADARIRAGV